MQEDLGGGVGGHERSGVVQRIGVGGCGVFFVLRLFWCVICLACLPVGGGLWCGWVAGRAVLGDMAVHLPGRTGGHRTHQTTILA